MKLLYKVLIGVGVAVVAVAAAGVGTLYGIWGKELNSISSIKEIIPAHESNKAGKVYEMTMDGGYYFNEFIEQGGVSNDDDLIQFIVDNITKGLIPISMKAPEVGCSSFTVIDENGNNLFGRNYDFASTSSLILHTNPGNGRHASISSVDLQFLGLGDGIGGLMDKLTAIAAAYAPLDGMNDADKSYSTDQQTDKPDLTSTTMLRMILDYADDVDEAVALVKKYDFHDSANSSFHYMVADKSGKSAILEWVNEDATDSTDIDGTKRVLKVYYNDKDETLGEDEAKNNFQYITNFIVTPGYYANENQEDMKGLDRYNYIKNTINPDGTNTEGKFTKEESLNLLKDLGRRKWNQTVGSDSNNITVWSVLYDLDNLEATWISNEEFDEEGSVFTFSLNK